MKIEGIKIKNYKFIKELQIEQMENVCILIGRNSTGKTMILDAIMAAFGLKECTEREFHESDKNVEITVKLFFSQEDLMMIHRLGQVSRYKRYELFYQDFCNKFPSFQNNVLTFTFVANKNSKVRYSDGIKKDNPFIKKILPKIYFIDNRREIKEIHSIELAFNLHPNYWGKGYMKEAVLEIMNYIHTYVTLTYYYFDVIIKAQIYIKE